MEEFIRFNRRYALVSVLCICFQTNAEAEDQCKPTPILIIKKQSSSDPEITTGSPSRDEFTSKLESAEILFAKDKRSQALASFKKALPLAQTAGDRLSVLNSIANCEFELLRTGKAIEAYDQALCIFKSESKKLDQRWERVLKVNKAAALIEEGKLNEARVLLSIVESPSFYPGEFHTESADRINKVRTEMPDFPMPSSGSKSPIMDLEAVSFLKHSYWSNEKFSSWKADPRQVIIRWCKPGIIQKTVLELLAQDDYPSAFYLLQSHSRDMKALYGPASKQAQLAEQAAKLLSNKLNRKDSAATPELPRAVGALLTDLEVIGQ